MSDLHGCFDLYKKMLDRIKLKEEDVLYILGDLVDRGDKPMEILLDVADRRNVVTFCGNHDYRARAILKRVVSGNNVESLKCSEDYDMWLEDGGNTTIEAFMKLTSVEKQKALSVLDNLILYKRLVLRGRHFFMAHTVPEKELFEEFDKLENEDFILGEPDYELVYDENLTIITGHTPTSFIDEKYRGRIWKNNNHIAVDCGAVFNGRLGCLCLDTMEEIYVN